LPAFFHLRQRSLARANTLVLGSVALAVPLSHFPHLLPSPLVAIPTLLAILGMADTLRCIRPRWSLYHAGVMLCLYMDLMAVSLLLFLLLYPYYLPLSGAH
jgi:hypothetical protein